MKTSHIFVVYYLTSTLNINYDSHSEFILCLPKKTCF